ncbi:MULTISPECIES: SCO2400 family protein [Streptomyces]|uniref:SCO2400 family protein n=1 Tax=Streptomyces TaxID=1883 RepID=UPI003420CF3A
MDYCSSCRRNLNGALVCPGCGDYAPDIAPPTHRRNASQVDAATTAPSWEAWPMREDDDPASLSGLGAPNAGYAPEGDAASGASEAAAEGAGTAGHYEGGAPDGLGRAARRRQLARWKKYRRRAAAATALALVGGGLTASLLQHKPATDHAQAAAAPDPTDAATPRTMNTKASSKEPDGHPSRHHDNRPSRGSASRHPTVASTPSAAPTSQPPATTAPAPRHPAAPRATPHTTSAPAGTTHHHGAAAAPKTTPPPSDSQPGTGTATTSPAQTAPTADPTSPTCLLGVVCVG